MPDDLFEQQVVKSEDMQLQQQEQEAIEQELIEQELREREVREREVREQEVRAQEIRAQEARELEARAQLEFSGRVEEGDRVRYREGAVEDVKTPKFGKNKAIVAKTKEEESLASHSHQMRGNQQIALTAAVNHSSNDVLKLTKKSPAALRKVMESIRAYSSLNINVTDAVVVLKKLQEARSNIDNYLAEHKGTLECGVVSDFKRYFDVQTAGNLKTQGIVTEDFSDDTEIELAGIKVGNAAASVANIKWKSVENQPLFPTEITSNDLVQGNLGDCYLLAALSAVVMDNPEIIKNSMVDNGKTVTVRLFSSEKNGADQVAQKPIYITVSKTIPSLKGGSVAPYAQNSLWVQMYEKAYACSGLSIAAMALRPANTDRTTRIRPSYQLITGGLPDETMTQITGETKRAISIPGRNKLEVIGIANTYYNAFLHLFLTNMEMLSKGNIYTDGIEALFKGHIKTYTDANNAKIKYCEEPIYLEEIEPKVRQYSKEFLASYQSILGAPIDELLDSLMGSQKKELERMYYHRPFSGLYTKNALKCMLTMEDALKSHKPVTVSTRVFIPDEARTQRGHSGGEALSSGLASPHAYSVVRISQDDDGNKFVWLRNPWGARGLAYTKTVNSSGEKSYSSDFSRDTETSGVFKMELNDLLSKISSFQY